MEKSFDDRNFNSRKGVREDVLDKNKGIEKVKGFRRDNETVAALMRLWWPLGRPI